MPKEDQPICKQIDSRASNISGCASEISLGRIRRDWSHGEMIRDGNRPVVKLDFNVVADSRIYSAQFAFVVRHVLRPKPNVIERPFVGRLDVELSPAFVWLGFVAHDANSFRAFCTLIDV
jgi:hypothetical protein